jgi:hypothetical protein
MPLEIDLSQFGDEILEGRQFGPFIHRTGEGAIRSTDVPRISELQGFSSTDPNDVADMHGLLREFGRDDARTLLERQASQLERFGFVSGTPRFDAEMQRLVDTGSNTALLAEARRTSERYESLVAIDGNPNQEVIRVAEGPDPCELCEAETGTEGTYAELAQQGLLPGGSSCLGGDLCLCVVVPIE